MSYERMRRRSVPPGEYTARLVAIDETMHAEFGPGLCFKFVITEGPHQRRQVWRFTSAKATASNATGRFISGLSWRPVKTYEDINLDWFIGRSYGIQVEPTLKGTRVESAQLDMFNFIT